jgi:hypothetical protein
MGVVQAIEIGGVPGIPGKKPPDYMLSDHEIIGTGKIIPEIRAISEQK